MKTKIALEEHFLMAALLPHLGAGRIAAMDAAGIATRQFFDQMPISHADKEKIAHLNAERLFVSKAGKPARKTTSSIKAA